VAIGRSRVAVVILAILGWAAAVHADDASRPPAGTRTLTDTPFQLVLPQQHLLPWLRDHGLGARLSRSIGQSDAVLLRGLFPSRPTDVGGFGVVYGRFSADRQASQRRAQQSDPTVGVQRYETALELTYRFRLRGGAVFFQPDLQYIIRPGGTGRIADAFVAGFQSGINF